MSRQPAAFDVDGLPAPVCAVCGLQINEADQDCVALDDGRCQP